MLNLVKRNYRVLKNEKKTLVLINVKRHIRANGELIVSRKLPFTVYMMDFLIIIKAPGVVFRES